MTAGLLPAPGHLLQVLLSPPKRLESVGETPRLGMPIPMPPAELLLKMQQAKLRQRLQVTWMSNTK